MDLAILIASYNTRRVLEDCLESLHRHPPAATHQIVVIDNASSDGRVEAVQARWPGVHVITLPRNVGFGSANNHGFRASHSTNVLVLNSDTLATPGAIDALLKALDELPGAAVVGPRLVNASGEPEISYGRMMGPLSELRQKALSGLGSADRIRRMTSSVHEADWVSGACLLVRRTVAEAAGLFDERYFMYCEDVDFCAAVRAGGGRVYFTPAAEVIHLGGRSAAPTTQEAYRRSQLAFYDKHHPAWSRLLRFYLFVKGRLPAPSADK